MRDKLRKWREDNNRNSEQIVDVGEELISEHASKLGDDSKFVQLLLFAKLKTLLQHPYICCNWNMIVAIPSRSWNTLWCVHS